jgi:hypothetical protein
VSQTNSATFSSTFTIFPVVKQKRQEIRSENVPEVPIAFISVGPDRIIKTIGMLALLLVLSSIAIQLIDQATGQSSLIIHKLVKFLNVDLELNLPTFFSVLILLFSSLLLAGITFIKNKQSSSYVLHWAVLSAGFAFMAFDEAFSFHERLIEPFRSLLGEVNLGVLYFAWVVPAILLIGALSLAYLKFGLSLPSKTRLWFGVSAILYLGAAVGFELIEGRHVEVYGKENLFYIALATTEEAIEMAAIVLFIRTLLKYIAEIGQSVVIQMDSFRSSESLSESTIRTT